MILCGGETLIDFIPCEARDGSPAYRPANGGSVHNVALALGRLGVPVGFVGGISTDFFGEALAAGLQANGVSLTHVSRLDRPTTLAFVKLDGREARYAFYDEGAADRHWRLEAMPAIGPEVKTLQFGGISLIRLPAAEAYAALMLRERGRRLISFDPNIRPSLVRDEADYRRRLAAFLYNSDVIKVSDADLAWIAPGADPAALAAEWLARSARLVLLTRGAEGATAFGRIGRVSRPAVPVDVADTVGAGDAFMAGFLAALHDGAWLDRAAMERLSTENLSKALDFALAVAAVTCSRVGADPPRRSELSSYLRASG
jgi:fructokinase